MLTYNENIKMRDPAYLSAAELKYEIKIFETQGPKCWNNAKKYQKIFSKLVKAIIQYIILG